MSKQLVRKWFSRSLPILKQGSTLSIRSNAKNTNISIRSEWRDDGYLSLLHKKRINKAITGTQSHNNNNNGNNNNSKDKDSFHDIPYFQIFKHNDQMTSMGRHESHISIHLNDHDNANLNDDSTATTKLKDPLLSNGKPLSDSEAPPGDDSSSSSSSSSFSENIVVLDDGTVLPDSPEFHSQEDYERIKYNDRVTLVVKQNKNDDKQSQSQSQQYEDDLGMMLAMKVPEKLNINCDLTNGGSIQIHNKIEGDVRLKTTDGDVLVKKLRGHVLDIQVHGDGNSIYSTDLLEAGSLFISAPSSGRFRAKRIHAGNCTIRLGMESDNNLHNQNHNDDDQTREKDSVDDQGPLSLLFDVDDSGAVCDISSLYVTNDANVDYRSDDNNRQPIRIKSNHGHVIVDATSPKPTKKNEMTDRYLPIVDLGGVNGSCEAYIRGSNASSSGGTTSNTTNNSNDNNADDDDDEWVSCHVHFDSILPDSVSLLKADIGDIQMTVDRKVESDIRLLSASDLTSLNLDLFLMEGGNNNGDDDASNNEDYSLFQDMLKSIDKSSVPRKQKNMISIQTKAFTEKSKENKEGSGVLSTFNNCQFVDGWIENKSAEPDSRFDRKIRGDSVGSVGKIRLDGAETQALKGFQKSRGSGGSGDADGSGHDNNTNGTKDGNEFPRPIVAAASTGKISLETLSWLGNIARRYGLDDKRDAENLGRTATRRGRSLEPTSSSTTSTTE